jgi:HK97 family phage portal protein
MRETGGQRRGWGRKALIASPPVPASASVPATVEQSRSRSLLGWLFPKRPVEQNGVQPVRPVSSTAGVVVTVNNALEQSGVWACSRLLAETTGTIPLILYEVMPDGSKRKAIEHPLYAMLHDAPSYDFTAVEFWEGVVLSLCLPGNAVARKEFMGDRLVALTPMDASPGRMRVWRDDQGARRYGFRGASGEVVYGEDEIFHVRGFGGTGDLGLSPVGFARQSIGAALAADRLAAESLAQGLQTQGFFAIDQTLNPDQREQIHTVVNDTMAAARGGGYGVLEAGLTWIPVSMSYDDAQFIQTRGFQLEDVCRWYRVPPWMVGHYGAGQVKIGQGWEQEMTAFLTFSLRPYLVRIEQAITRSLLRVVDRGRYKAEFAVDALLRGDSAARAAFYEIMVRNGLMTRNEARRLENLPPLPGGDSLMVQAQNVPLDAAPTGGGA